MSPTASQTLQDALCRMLFPSSAYRKVSSFSQSQVESPESWKQQADEILDALVLDVEFSIPPHHLPEEVSDLTGEATIDPRSKNKATSAIEGIGQMLFDREVELRDQMQGSLLLDLQNLAPVLLGPENAGIRQMEGVAEDVPQAWMEAVDAVGGLPQFLDFSSRLLSVDELDWWLSHCSPPSSFENLAAESALEDVSRYAAARKLPSDDFAAHANVFVSWIARSRNWKTSPRVSSIYLANALTDPNRRLCAAMEANGFKFSIENVSWRDLLTQFAPAGSKSSPSVSDVQSFLVKHAVDLAVGWPQWADLPAKGDTEGNRYSIKNFDQGTTLRSMLVNIEKDDVRADIQASIDRAILANATPKPRKPSRPSRRI